MNFKILGPLEVVDGDRPVHLEGTKPRMILCALLASPGDVVSMDRLIDWLWPPDDHLNVRVARAKDPPSSPAEASTIPDPH